MSEADQDTLQEEQTSEPAAPEAPPAASTAAPASSEPQRQPQQQPRPPREGQPPRDNRAGGRGPREGQPRGENRGGGRTDESRGPRREGDGRGGPREGDRGRGDRGDRGGGRPEFAPEIDLEKLISDPLYLDNQAHAVVSRMRDMDSGTRSQLRRLYNAVRRAVRAPESERQHEFVMLRARLAYTIARHSLRSLDTLEKLLLQVTRKNDARGYERFRDLFEAIVAYNE
jgi:CRISPR type III-A-associated protein Csm2